VGQRPGPSLKEIIPDIRRLLQEPEVQPYRYDIRERNTFVSIYAYNSVDQVIAEFLGATKLREPRAIILDVYFRDLIRQFGTKRLKKFVQVWG